MSISCWTLTSDKAGCQKQANGIAKALGLHYTEKQFAAKTPWHCLPATWHRHPERHATPTSSPLIGPWPDILIACGIRSLPFAFAAQKASQGKTALVYVQNPRVHPKYFDAVIAPIHDRLSGPNVITMLGAPHDIDPHTLKNAAKQLAPHFAKYPKPYTAIFLGGSTKRYTLTLAHAKTLADQLCQLAKTTHGSLLISPSRRTGEAGIAYLKTRFAAHSNIYFHTPEAPNPYYAMLGLADTILITNDSVSMISEACSTEKPVFLLPLPAFKPTKKVQHFLQQMIAGNHTAYYTTGMRAHPFTPLKEMQHIIAPLKALLASKVSW